jgi:hypothetical protein
MFQICQKERRGLTELMEICDIINYISLVEGLMVLAKNSLFLQMDESDYGLSDMPILVFPAVHLMLLGVLNDNQDPI